MKHPRYLEKLKWSRDNPESCRKSRQKYYAKNREKILLLCKEYVRKNKGRIKMRMRAYNKKAYPLKRQRIIAQTRAYAKSHPEVRSKIARNYKKRHPEKFRAALKAHHSRRKAAMRGAAVGDRDVSKVISGWRMNAFFICSYCQNVFPTSELQVDHIVAVSKGGEHSCENVAESCAMCNIRKKGKNHLLFLFSNQ